MKILVFSDGHGSAKALRVIADKAKKEKPDLMICLGDFTIFGQDQKKILKKINDIGIKTLLLHGNHEILSEVKEDVKGLKNIMILHKKVYRQDDVLFVGYGGGGFSLKEPKFKDLDKVYRKIRKKKEKTVLLTHGPPYGTELDRLYDDQHCGCRDYNVFIKKHKPILALSGHIHECEGAREEIGPSLLVNIGPEGEIFEI